MFLTHFRLHQQPFGVAPDPRFLYLGAQHREALASLAYGTESNRGFLALIAPPGMGKTSLLFQYLESLRGEARTAFLFQTDCDSRELLHHILSDLGLDVAGTDLPSMHGMLNRILEEEMKSGRRFVLVVDEAQNLDDKGLETLRLLSNFETPWAKLMHIVIAGQPELATRLARASMSQLRQRISLFLRLRPFSREETNAYMDHRLCVSGHSGPPLFSERARSLVFRYSAGIPRNINNLCFGAMSLAYAAGAKQVAAKMVREAVSDLEIDSIASRNYAVSVRSDSRRWCAPVRQNPQRAWRMVPALATALAFVFLALAFAVPWNSKARRPLHSPLESSSAVSAQALPEVTATKPLLSDAEPSDQAPPQPAALAERPAAPPAAPPAAARIITVTVPSGANLRQLSLRYLGKFDVPTLLEICALNPEIADPSQVQAGQRIRLPLHEKAVELAKKEIASQIAQPKPHEEHP